MFFTAPVKESYARHGQASERAQTQYHRALQAYRDVAQGVCDHFFQEHGQRIAKEAVKSFR